MPRRPSRPSGRASSSRPASAGRPDRKTLQLCEQVRHTLEYVLTGELDDDLLRMLYVAKVEPAPNADRLLVTVTPLMTKGERPDPVQVMTKLHAVAASLRGAVAASISRRKVPDLLYAYADSDPTVPEARRDEEE